MWSNCLGQTNQAHACLICLKHLKKEQNPNWLVVVHAVIVFESRILGFCVCVNCEPFLCLFDTSLGLCLLSCTECDPSPKL